MKNDEILKISDLTLATTLLFLGYKFVYLDMTNPSRIVFEFSKNKSIQETIDKYWSGQISVEPKNFNNIQRELKARIRSLQK